METAINETEVKKDLYKSKVNAKFSHYASGNLFYTVELADGVYQFPISTIEKNSMPLIEAMVNAKNIELEKQLMELNPDKINLIANAEKNEDPLVNEIENEINSLNSELNNMLTLSSDLGITPFANEVKASELNRWIAKAIKKEEFIKIN